MNLTYVNLILCSTFFSLALNKRNVSPTASLTFVCLVPMRKSRLDTSDTIKQSQKKWPGSDQHFTVTFVFFVVVWSSCCAG